MTSDEKLAHRVHDLIEDKFHGDSIATNLVKASRHSGIHVPLACAIIEHETGFKNVYGHDGVRNPIKSPPGGLKRVTRANYALYKMYRKRGYGMQGVGPAQLTWYTYQDEADRLGGCWNPYYNMLVGFRALHSNIQTYGTEVGIQRYNGSGSAAVQYSRDIIATRDRWRAWLDRD